MRGARDQPIGRMNDSDRIAPSVAAALIGHRRTVCVVVISALSKLRRRRRLVIMRRLVAVAMLRVIMIMRGGSRRMIMALDSCARVTRRAAGCKGKRDGDGQNDDSAALHAIAIL